MSAAPVVVPTGSVDGDDDWVVWDEVAEDSVSTVLIEDSVDRSGVAGEQAKIPAAITTGAANRMNAVVARLAVT